MSPHTRGRLSPLPRQRESHAVWTAEQTRAIAPKDAVACQVQRAMEKEKITKVEMARRMHTSRAALDRLLAPGKASVTLQTLTRAARAIGRDLRFELV